MIYLLYLLWHQLPSTYLYYLWSQRSRTFYGFLILRRKIAYVMLTSIPWEYVIFTSIPWEWWVVGTNLANIEPNRNSHDFNVHVINLLP